MDMKPAYWLIAIVSITLLCRLILAFSVPNFTYESYFHLRQVEHIKETGTPLFVGELSGREFVFLPFFHYFIAAWSFLFPLEILAKIIPNLFIAALPLIAYGIAKKITTHKHAPLFSALITGFLPILFFTNSFTPETLALPLIFLAIFSFLQLKEKKYLYLYILLFLTISLTGLASILIAGLFIYIIVSFVERKSVPAEEMELIFFSLFFFLWINFLFYKNVFINEGISFMWENIPVDMVTQYYPTFSLAEAILLVSIIPFVVGIYVTFRSLFRLHDQKTVFLISFVLSTTLFTWFRFIRFKHSLTVFGIILAILFAEFYEQMYEYLSKTKFHRHNAKLALVIIILLLSTMIPAAISTGLRQDVPGDEEIHAFTWLQEHTPAKAGIAATLKEGHLITYYGKRRNIMDDQFGLVENVEERFADLNSLYTTPFETRALEITDKYDIQYIVVTPHAQEHYDIQRLPSYSRACFRPSYKNQTIIYNVRCTLKTIS